MIEDVERTPWATIETLRGSMGAADCNHLMLGRVIVGYVYYIQAKSTGLTVRLADPADESHHPQSGR
jgi:hypothetical protein